MTPQMPPQEQAEAMLGLEHYREQEREIRQLLDVHTELLAALKRLVGPNPGCDDRDAAFDLIAKVAGRSPKPSPAVEDCPLGPVPHLTSQCNHGEEGPAGGEASCRAWDEEIVQKARECRAGGHSCGGIILCPHCVRALMTAEYQRGLDVGEKGMQERAAAEARRHYDEEGPLDHVAEEIRVLPLSAADGPAPANRACTCHPSEAPVPCQHRYAYSECKAAVEAPAPSPPTAEPHFSIELDPSLPPDTVLLVNPNTREVLQRIEGLVPPTAEEGVDEDDQISKAFHAAYESQRVITRMGRVVPDDQMAALLACLREAHLVVRGAAPDDSLHGVPGYWISRRDLVPLIEALAAADAVVR